MRLPSMTTPEPKASIGEALLHGRATSGRRMVENTFTTALSASCAITGLGSAAGFGAAPAAGASAPASSQLPSRTWDTSLMNEVSLQFWTADSDIEAQACPESWDTAARCADRRVRQGDAGGRIAPD